MGYYLKKHWKINLLIAVLQILWAGVRVLNNVVSMQVGQGLFDLNLRRFLFWSAVNLLLWGVAGALDVVRTKAKSKAKMDMNDHVRADMVASILKKNHQEYHAQQSGEYLSQFSNDVNQIAGFAWDGFYGMISLGAQVVFSIAALTQLHWSLLVVSVIDAVIMLYFPKIFEKRVESLSEACAIEQAKAMGKMKDLLSGLDVLRFFGRTDRFVKGNAEASHQMEHPKYRQAYIQAYMEEAINMVNTTLQCLISVLIGILSIKGVILQAALIGGGNLCGTVCGGLTTASQLRLSIRASKPYFDKITTHAGEAPASGETPLQGIRDAITVENLSFRYGEKPILENASFRFEKGGKYALTGPSGCGKSTLLKLLLGWLPDYTGKISLDGRDARDFSTDQLQQSMSYIEQDVFLFNSTIRDNITLGGSFTQEQMEKALRGSALEGDLRNMPLGLDTPVGEDGSALSGGQKQRVAIARALIHDRSILLVDEGTSALDQKNADIVEQSLLENPDLTLILVSHHLSPERKAQFTRVYRLEPVAPGE